jgi:hypothetical protein
MGLISSMEMGQDSLFLHASSATNQAMRRGMAFGFAFGLGAGGGGGGASVQRCCGLSYGIVGSRSTVVYSRLMRAACAGSIDFAIGITRGPFSRNVPSQ